LHLYCLQMYSLDATPVLSSCPHGLPLQRTTLKVCARVCVCTSRCGRYLTRLEVLSIKNNKIAHINYHFCSLTQLRELSLSHNKLTVRLACIYCLLISIIPCHHDDAPMFPCRHVRASVSVSVRSQRLPNFFGNFCSMTHLWLSNNKISSLPIDEHVKLLEFDPVTGERSRFLAPPPFRAWQECQLLGLSVVICICTHAYTREDAYTFTPTNMHTKSH
jgi:hypothetical protein